MDLSYNDFESHEAEIIEIGLNQNHTILGIHTTGNEMSTDAMGFVKHHDHNGWGDEVDFALEQIFSRIP